MMRTTRLPTATRTLASLLLLLLLLSTRTTTIHGFTVQAPLSTTTSTARTVGQHATTTTPSSLFRRTSTNNRFGAATTTRTHQSSTSLSSSSTTTTSLNAAKYDYECDVLVLGGGPTGRAVASLFASSSNNDWNVILADASHEKPFVPNYGVWRDEWDAVVDRYRQMGVSLTGGEYGEALNRQWDITDCFFGGSFDIPTEQRQRLDRPYCQVDKNALKQSLVNDSNGVTILPYNHDSKAIGINIYSPTGSLVHDETGSTIRLVSKDDESDTVTVRARIIIDTTGHETQLVLRDTKADANRPPGFQIAYGCLADLDESSVVDKTMCGPYDKEAMTLFDYRTDHFDGDDSATQKAIEEPTFMYVMPLKDNKVFFEETSLVARPAVSFQECKDRCFRRLDHLGIKVNAIEEEEFCYIPMGGSLPIRAQRVVGLGGASAMVHPSTGYHLCRMLMGVADAVSAMEQNMLSNKGPDEVAASAYHAVWTPENIRQRNFAVFGGEFLMERDVVGLRGFFDGFFRLPLELWGGFLAGWPGLPNNVHHETWYARLWFGLSFIVKLPPPVALAMAKAILMYTLEEGTPLMQSVTPLVGEPASYEYDDYVQANAGDVAAKLEAKSMIQQSAVTEEVPTAFTEDEETTEAEILVA